MLLKKFLKAYQNLNNFKFDSKFYSWIYRIAVNTSLNYINSKEKEEEKETISDEFCHINDKFVFEKIQLTTT